jgi:hypothetical protein
MGTISGKAVQTDHESIAGKGNPVVLGGAAGGAIAARHVIEIQDLRV